MQLPPWLMVLWKMLDESLAQLSRRLQGFVRLLRIVRALLIIGVLAVLLSGVLAVLSALRLLDIRYFLYSYALASLFLLVPLAILVVLVGLPLKARSVIRLIDKGYPENAREIAIRVMARKLHDQSIATEELLWDTAVNEGRKVLRRMRRDEAEPRASEDPDSDEPAGAPPL